MPADLEPDDSSSVADAGPDLAARLRSDEEFVVILGGVRSFHSPDHDYPDNHNASEQSSPIDSNSCSADATAILVVAA